MKDELIAIVATGIVLGNYWGGGQGAYQARTITGTNKDEVLGIANAMLKNKSLDKGMGFESLVGARLILTTIRTIIHNRREYTNQSDEIVFIGDLSAKQKRQLSDLAHYQND